MSLVGSRIGHVRIDRAIGHGGMGEVFEGFDEVLERRVAVKAIGLDPELSEEARIRFLREARALARLDHPGICQIYDCVEGDGESYLVLELVDGETLKHHARSELAHGEKLRIALHLARVLRLAHEAGIVHRDLKPENVMITPSGDVKVLDFGLARLLGPAAAEPPTTGVGVTGRTGREPDGTSDAVSDVAATVVEPQPRSASQPSASYIDVGLTRAGTIVGTLAYMAPEQAEGRSPTPACDVYSYGILLQELLTGRSAYPSGLEWTQLLMLVRDAGRLPAEGVEPELRNLLDELTAREPGDRPSMAAVVARLEQIIERPERLAHRRRIVFSWSAVGAALLATAALTYLVVRPRSLLASGQQGRVALLPLVNATGDPAYEWVERGLVQMLADNIGRTPGIEVIPPEDARKALERIGHRPGEPLGADELRQLGRAIGAELLVSGTVKSERRGYRIEARLDNVAGSTGAQQAAAPELTEAANLLAERIVHRIKPEALAADIKDTFSADVFASRAYAIGADLAGRGNVKRARTYFDVALDRDPAFLRSRHALAKCLEALGEYDEAERIDGEVLAAARERSEPELEAMALTNLAAIDMMRGRFAEAREALEQALAVHRRLGNASAVANCLNQIGRTHITQGNPPEAQRYFEQALAAYEAIESREGIALTLSNLGLARWRQGDWPQATELFTRAMETGRELRDVKIELTATVNLGGVRMNARDFDQAREHFGHALTLAEESGDYRAGTAIRNNLAGIAFHTGDLDRARELYEANASRYRETGERPRLAMVLSNLGQVAAMQDRLDEAERLTREALAIREELKDTRGQAVTLTALGRIMAAARRPADATRHLQASLALARAVGDPETESEDLVLLARIAIERGDLDRAAALVAEAKRWHSDHYPALLAESMIASARGGHARALEILERARAAAGDMWSAQDQVELERIRARAGRR